MTRHLVVIGAQRSGTTFLNRVLEAHPDVATARPARPEPKVFCSPEIVQKGRDWYRDTYFHHAASESILAEKSTSYIEHPEAAQRIEEVLGQVDVVVSLRDPVARAVSNWRFSASNGFEHRPLDVALRENLQDARSWDPELSSVSPFAYLERGHYAKHLEPWWAVFGRRVRVVFFEEMTSQPDWPARFYGELGLSTDVPVATSAVNASEGSEPELTPELVADLRAHFAESDRALAERLGRALPWSTTAQGDQGEEGRSR